MRRSDVPHDSPSEGQSIRNFAAVTLCAACIVLSSFDFNVDMSERKMWYSGAFGLYEAAATEPLQVQKQSSHISQAATAS